jgi:hypothetical protein
MSIKTELSRSWIEWKRGAKISIVFGIAVFIGVLAATLTATVIVLGAEWIFDYKEIEREWDGLIILFSIAWVPIAASGAREVLADALNDGH